jgi:hypothetical protein
MDNVTLVLVILIAAATVLAAVVLAVWWARRGGRGTVLSRLVAAGALLAIVLVAASTVVITVSAIVSDTITLDVPVIATFELPDTDLHAGSTIITSGTSADLIASVTVSGAPAAARAWLVAAHILNAAVAITVLAVIAQFARQTATPEPFTTPLRRALVTAGAALAIGLTATQILFGIAGSLVRDDIYAIRLPEGVDETTLFSVTGVEVDLLPIGIGLVIIVAAGLIRSGQRLQADVEGLV